jgi:hypothetical protein
MRVADYSSPRFTLSQSAWRFWRINEDLVTPAVVRSMEQWAEEHNRKYQGKTVILLRHLERAIESTGAQPRQV